MRLTATITKDKNPGALTVSAAIEIPESATDVGARLCALLNELAGALEGAPSKPVAAVATSVSPTNGHASLPKQPATAVVPTNGNGNGGNGEGQRISPKQRGFLLGLAAKQGLKLADVNVRIRARLGDGANINNITKSEASALIDELKADAPPLKGE
jgi:hypothetical protein